MSINTFESTHYDVDTDTDLNVVVEFECEEDGYISLLSVFVGDENGPDIFSELSEIEVNAFIHEISRQRTAGRGRYNLVPARR